MSLSDLPQRLPNSNEDFNVKEQFLLTETTLNEEQKQSLWNLLEKNKDIFAQNPQRPEATTLV
jgi:hypothetical protein